MRKALGLTIALALSIAAGVGPAAAEPANSSGAYAYGAQIGGGLVGGSPLVEAGPVSQPPDADVAAEGELSPTLLTVPLGTLALAGVVGANARAHQADDIVPTLGTLATPGPGPLGDPIANVGVNAQGLAKVAGAGVVFEAPEGTVDAVALMLSNLGGLLTADAITAEATAKCVNNQAVYDTGFEILEPGGIIGNLLQGVTDPALATLITLLNTLGQTLGDILSVESGRITPLPNGIAIDGLVVTVLGIEIVLAHAEAFMPATGCAVAPPAPPEPTGPDDIAPRAQLAVTGGDLPYLPMALALLGSAVLVRRIVRRRPESSSIG